MVPPQTNHFLLISSFFIVSCDLFLVPAASLGGGFYLVRKTDSRLRRWMKVSEGRGERRQGVGTSVIVSTIKIKFLKNSGCSQSCWASLQQAAWEPQHALEQGLHGEARSYSIGAPKITATITAATLQTVSRAVCALWFQTLFGTALKVWLALERLPVPHHEPQRPTTGILSTSLLMQQQGSPDANGPNADLACSEGWGQLGHSASIQVGSPCTPTPSNTQ